MTIKEIAKALGVAQSTVSKAINGKPDISDTMRKKILDYIESVNYTPNQTARNLSLNIRDTIAILMLDDLTSMGMTFLKGVVREAKDRGYDIQIFSFDHGDAQDYLRHCYSKQVVGGIIYGLGGNDPNIKSFEESKIPLVIVDQNVQGQYVKRLKVDSFHAEELVVDYLISKGFNKGVYMAACSSSDIAVERQEAFLKHATAHKLDVENINGDFSYEYGYSIDEHVDLKGASFIHTSSDLIALGVKDKLEKLGIDIPVIGYDDIPEAKYRKLSTVSQHPEQMGRAAVALMFSDEKDKVLRPELIIR